MKRCPKIGDRVRVAANCVRGACEGTVHAIYPSYEWDESDDHEKFPHVAEPESEWSVGVTVDKVPAIWPYPSTNKVAPSVRSCSLIRGDR